MTIVFKVSDNIKPKIISYYKDLKKDKTPPYAVFQAVEADTVITLYESGKIMFQGTSADVDANIWIDMERKFNNRIIDINTGKEKKKTENKNILENIQKNLGNNKAAIGSDEVGTGDYFGPIVVTASYVEKDKQQFLIDLGVRDSKKITDEKILEIAPQIIKNIPHSTIIFDNISYNKYHTDDINMNKIKAILHNKALLNLIKHGYNYEEIIIDQFVNPQKYYEYLKNNKEIVKNITFQTKAEDSYLCVAASSIISRYIFISKMDELSKKVGINLPKGAGDKVDETAKEIINKFGFDKLTELAKLNFKNTDKIKKS